MTALHVSRPAEGVVLIEIDNPPANALGATMRAGMTAMLDGLESDLSVRAVVLTPGSAPHSHAGPARARTASWFAR